MTLPNEIIVYIFKENDILGREERLIRAAQLYCQGISCASGEERVGECIDKARFQVEKTPLGKPYFSQARELHFSISHSGAYWACAVADYPVGLDLQVRRKKYSFRIAERFFHPDEKTYLLGNGDFYAVWTAKESYVKYTGTGIGEGFDRFAVADETGMLNYVKIQGDCGPELRMTEIIENYCCCICAEVIGEVIFRKNA